MTRKVRTLAAYASQPAMTANSKSAWPLAVWRAEAWRIELGITHEELWSAHLCHR